MTFRLLRRHGMEEHDHGLRDLRSLHGQCVPGAGCKATAATVMSRVG
ncbi:MAG: hypothetical protein QM757_07310 [Paludibaculum sp.]